MSLRGEQPRPLTHCLSINTKMKNALLISITLFLTNAITAQEQRCDCEVVFSDLVQKLEENYIGLAQMKMAGPTIEYDKLTAKFKKITSDTREKNCTKILQEFLGFFEDGHLFVFERPDYTKNELDSIKQKIKGNKISIGNVLNVLKQQERETKKDKLNHIIGKWTDGKSAYAIIKKDEYYNAYVISSKLDGIEAGELKAQFKQNLKGFEVTIYSSEYAPRYVEANLYKEATLLVLSGGIYWGRMDSASDKALNVMNENDVKLPTVVKLDEKNTLLTIPSFLANFDDFVKIIKDNEDLLKATTNLIIDIRGNVGGNAMYFVFIDAYATQKLKGSQGLVLASEATKKYFEWFAERNPDLYAPVVERINNNMGQIIDGPLYPDQEFSLTESKIENVAMLTDKACMSAAESFILHSKGVNNNVKTFGSPTGGVIDYTSINTLKLESGRQHISFGYPTSTLHKDIPENGYNKTGIIPDVPIDDNVKNKIEYIVKYYQKK